MTRNIFSYLVIADTQQWFFEDFKSASKFVDIFDDKAADIRIYKLVYNNGGLVKNVK